MLSRPSKTTDSTGPSSVDSSLPWGSRLPLPSLHIPADKTRSNYSADASPWIAAADELPQAEYQLTLDSFEASTVADSGYGSLYTSTATDTGHRSQQRILKKQRALAKPPMSSSTRSMSSNTSTTENSGVERQVLELAEEIAAIFPRTISTDALQAVAAALPDLLKACAFKLAHDNTEELHMPLAHRILRSRRLVSPFNVLFSNGR